MTKAQIMVSLERHADITPNYVTMVWEKLEEQNPAFFWSYGLHLQLKEQVGSVWWSGCNCGGGGGGGGRGA